MLRGVLDRVQPLRSVKKRDVADAGAVEFKGAKGPLDSYSWVDKMEMAFESTELPEEKKVKMTVSFLDDSAHHWWTLARRNNDGAQTMTWEQFKALFLVRAAMAIETRGTYRARPRDFSGPSQGPSKKAASSSASGSSAGSGSSGGSGYGSRGRFAESFGKFSLEVIPAGLTSGFRVKFGAGLDIIPTSSEGMLDWPCGGRLLIETDTFWVYEISE
ncbi:hypothetical protein ACLB2K_059686 [Fragaria x ananassa]